MWSQLDMEPTGPRMTCFGKELRTALGLYTLSEGFPSVWSLTLVCFCLLQVKQRIVDVFVVYCFPCATFISVLCLHRELLESSVLA